MFHDFKILEENVKKAKFDKSFIFYKELGAHKTKNTSFKMVGSIAKSSSTPKFVREVLYKTINAFQPRMVVELGCSLGLTSQYLLKAMPPNSILCLMDGNDAVLRYAYQLCTSVCHHSKKILTFGGDFHQALQNLLAIDEQIDFIYLDGNHQGEFLISYVDKVLPKLSPHAILVFDDIYWDSSMYKAWKKIVQNPCITYSIDMFYTGFCFLGLNAAKQDIMLKYPFYDTLFNR